MKRLKVCNALLSLPICLYISFILGFNLSKRHCAQDVLISINGERTATEVVYRILTFADPVTRNAERVYRNYCRRLNQGTRSWTTRFSMSNLKRLILLSSTHIVLVALA